MRLTILWSPLASYTIAFFRALVESEGWQIQLIYHSVKENAPYGRFELDFCKSTFEYAGADWERLLAQVEEFRPDCILMSSWNFSHFMRLSLHLRRRGVYVIASMDNQWRGTLRQRLGVVAAPWLLKRRIDNFLCAGDRQASFARKLGYPQPLFGLYAGDVSRFRCELPLEQRDRAFLFIGRLVEEKGVRQLLAGYRQYRQAAEHPWSLKVVGTGPLQKIVDAEPGVKHLGFVQPQFLPSVMTKASCFVLPSTREPWGVVVHEATAARLPVIASYQTGAVTAFVRDGVNGFIVPPKAAALAAAMRDYAALSVSRREEMGRLSGVLAELWDPERLARYFAERLTKSKMLVHADCKA